MMILGLLLIGAGHLAHAQAGGAVYSFGQNSFGQLGHGIRASRR